MFNSRRVQRVQEPEFDALPETPIDEWVNGDDPMAELARLVERDLETRSGQAQAALAAVPSDGPRPGAYDPWDDSALAPLPGDFGYDESEPLQVEEGVLPPHVAVEEEVAERPRRPWLLLGAVAAVALIAGGVGAYYLTSGGVSGFGEPQLVRAPEGPYKIVPEKGDAIDEPIEGEAVFDQVQGVPAKGNERLVTREESVPNLPGVNPQVSRVILPDGKEIAADAPDALSPAETGPRRVRTVLVKPNGDIIETPERPTAVAAPAAPSSDGIAALAGGTAPLPGTIVPAEDTASAAPTGEDEGSAAGLPPLDASEQTSEPAIVPPPAVAVAPVTVAPVTVAPTAEPPTSVEAVLPPPPEAPKPRPAKPAPAPVAHDGPLDLAATAAAPAPASRAVAPTQVAAVDPAAAPVAAAPTASTPAPAGGAYVQVSSQRSEAAALAAFEAMRRKNPGVLGGLSADVQRADLGAKGVYYRVRVPQPSKEQAVALCQSLKSAGIDCLIARK
ncbi:SPOR domain-containing protein [Oharaeibacter diazotrophicus]|uniref:Sporulation related protein n=2 Tax=Oharaeibacter diazotrophicus TaxID=1920512 RepID=A0A4R6RKC3_9HYPH|nr:SPOR domain-containing protein [Oharaeibacter diazotrophicus]TDP87013.1 sporulation related protein [Oharaeibacter diazotrophicus]BBE71044.1 sporulation related domain protein [Pleomorphomonas sp. SM30]GLS77794.1 hypothetical protein GCM10007904_31310 [Oharaeibacter diazotrophicus]